MKHYASREFWHSHRRLLPEVRDLADKNFAILKENPQHPSLHLKKVGRFFSVRVGIEHRALGVGVDDGILWFWIGSHADYDRLVGRG